MGQKPRRGLERNAHNAPTATLTQLASLPTGLRLEAPIVDGDSSSELNQGARSISAADLLT